MVPTRIEEGRVSVRNIRRDAIEKLRRLVADKEAAKTSSARPRTSCRS